MTMSLSTLQSSTDSTMERSLTWIRLLTETMAPMTGMMEGNASDTSTLTNGTATIAPTNASTPPATGVSLGSHRVGTGDFQFAAFVLWYLFLVVCCVLPTCCAFRRRRRIEARMAEQQAAFERSLRQHNIIVWNGGNGMPVEMETEAIKEERTRRLTEVLQSTTFTVKAQDITESAVTKEPAVSKEDPNPAEEEDESSIAMDEEMGGATTAAVEEDAIDTTLVTLNLNAEAPEEPPKEKPVSMDDNENESSILVDEELGGAASTMEQEVMDTKLLTLPTGSTGTNPEKPRSVPAGCAICLCSYEEGDSVTWSQCLDVCPHAFHTECIIPWLAKNKDPKCPCCRQHFCFLEPIVEPTPHISLLNPFGLVPTAVATPVRQFPFFLRGPLRLPISTPDLILAPPPAPVAAAAPAGHVIGHPPTLNLSQPYRGPPVPRRPGATTTAAAPSIRRQRRGQRHTPSWMTRLADLSETSPTPSEGSENSQR